MMRYSISAGAVLLLFCCQPSIGQDWPSVNEPMESSHRPSKSWALIGQPQPTASPGVMPPKKSAEIFVPPVHSNLFEGLPPAHEPIPSTFSAGLAPPTTGEMSIDGCQIPTKDAMKFFDVANPTPAPGGIVEVAAGLDLVSKNLTVLTLSKDIKLILGGAVTADFLYNSARPVAPGTPFLLTPGSAFGFSQDTFDTHARQTALFAAVTGPDIWDFKTSAVVLANFYDVSVVEDQYGFLPLEAFVAMKNDDWRFAAGLQFDVFNPLLPTVLPFSYLIGSGNSGNAYRGQARAVRYFYPGLDSQITLQFALSEPVATFFSRTFILNEDNGWPNVEGRIAYGYGPKGPGPLAKRPLEVGLSGIIGELRNTNISQGVRVVADVWGIGCDFRWEITKRCGFLAEGYVGQGLGTYGGAILSTVNPVTFNGIRSAGGFTEFYYYICPEVLHTHIGYGIDDPVDRDLGVAQPLRNQTVYGNIIWEVTSALRLGLEITYRETSYSPLLPDNDGVGIHGQVRYKF